MEQRKNGAEGLKTERSSEGLKGRENGTVKGKGFGVTHSLSTVNTSLSSRVAVGIVPAPGLVLMVT